MKKVTIILLSLMLVLSIGQAALAKGNIGLTVGYNGSASNTSISGLSIGVSGEYPLTNWFTLSGGFNADVYFKVHYTILKFNLDGKFIIYNTNKFNLGLQVNLKDSLFIVNSAHENYFSAGIGIFADYDINEKFNIYADVKSPFFVTDFIDYEFAPFFDVILGAKYAINSKIDLGLEASFNYSLPIPNFSIGAKLGYNF